MNKNYWSIPIILDYIVVLFLFYLAAKQSNVILAIFSAAILIRNEIRNSRICSDNDK